MRKVKNSQKMPCEIRFDEPQLQLCRLDLVLCVCLLFDTSGELLSCKQCLLIHLCASTPAEGCDFSTLVAQLREAQSRAHG